MTYDPEIDRHKVAECEAYEAAFQARLNALGVAEAACVECKRWRDLRHPLQYSCDDHCRELRQLHASQTDSGRQRYAATQRLDAYEAGRAAAAEEVARLMERWHDTGEGDALTPQERIDAVRALASDEVRS